MNPSTLHVVITGDEQVNVDKAGQMINDMLVVIDDEKNVHKQQHADFDGDEMNLHVCGITSQNTLKNHLLKNYKLISFLLLNLSFSLTCLQYLNFDSTQKFYTVFKPYCAILKILLCRNIFQTLYL